MRFPRFFFAAAAVLTAVVVLPSVRLLLASDAPARRTPTARQIAQYGSLPLRFEPVRATPNSGERYISWASGYTLSVSGADVLLQLRGGAGTSESAASVPVQMRLTGAAMNRPGEPLDRLPGSSNYFVGSDPRAWRTNVPQYGRVQYRDIYPGINLVYYGNQRQLEYDFVVQPGGDPRLIGLRYSGGVQSVRVDRDGDLLLGQADGRTLRQRRPVAYQEIDGQRVTVGSSYRLSREGNGQATVRIALARYDRTKPLVIDPTIVYSTFLGGAADDAIVDMAVDSSGNAYVTGTTSSADFPTTSGAYQQTCTTPCVFVTKLNASGTAVLYSTLLGGNSTSTVAGIAVDMQGNAYVTGTAQGSFPTTSGAFRSFTYPVGDSYAAKLSADGSTLVYATALDNRSNLNGYNCYYSTPSSCKPLVLPAAIAVDSSGDAYITGSLIGATAFPVVNAVQSTFGGGDRDAFVTALTPDGTGALYSTYLGGSGNDYGTAITVDSSGVAVVAGTTLSSDFPVTASAFQRSLQGPQNGFVAEIAAGGLSLQAATYLGGDGSDAPASVALDAQNNIYVTGTTSSTTFPTTSGAFLTARNNGFLSKLNPTVSSLLYSTYLAGNPTRVAVDATGQMYVVGTTFLNIAVTPGAYKSTLSGGTDAFLQQFNATGSALTYGTYLGGGGGDSGTGLALDVNGGVYVAGTTASSDFPVTAGAFQTTLGGGQDGFVAKFAFTSTVVCTYALSAPGQSVSAAGGSVSFNITTPSSCSYTAVSSAPFVTIASGATGTGNGAITLNVQANTVATARSATVTVGGQTFTITQDAAACMPMLSATSNSFGASGGVANITVTAATGCSYSASSNASWITINSGASGSGNTTVQYTVAANTGAARTGTLIVAGQVYTVTQAAGQSSDPITLTTTASTSLFNSNSAFTVDVGSTQAQTRTITLAANTAGVSYTSAVSGSPVFVTVSPASGSTPTSVVLTANPTGLAAGTYTNTVTFTAAGNTAATANYTVSLTVQAPGTNAEVGVFRPAAGLFLLDRNADGVCCSGDLIGTLGQTGDIALTGDWTGDGVKKIGIYRPSSGLFILDANNSGAFESAGDKVFFLAAQTGDVPVVGDWTGSGTDRIGVFRNGTWYLDVNGDGSFTGRAYLGQAGDLPLVGNWNGVGRSTKVGIYRPTASVAGQPGNFFLVDSNGDGQYTGADLPLFYLGQPGDVPLVGDWNGDGHSKVGIFRPSNGLFILDQNGNFAFDGPGTDRVLFFAPYLNGLTSTTSIQAGDLPLTGSWANSYAPPLATTAATAYAGKTRTGIYRPSTGTFFLDSTGDGTYQGRAFIGGQTGDVPVGTAPVVNASGAVLGVNGMGSY